MVFFFNLLGSLVYSFVIGKLYRTYNISNGALIVLFLPLIFVWLVICGGQDGVGTDYYSYYQIFNGYQLDAYQSKGEYLFYYLVLFLNRCGIKGQAVFYVFYGINFVFLFLIANRTKISGIIFFLLLYFTVSNLFNNQLNIIRQTTAIYIGTYGIIKLSERKQGSFLIYTLVASLIHISACLFLLLYFFYWVKHIPLWGYKLMLVVSFFLGVFFKMEWLNYIPNEYLPQSYAWHIQGGAVQETGVVVRLTKYIFIPFYWWSISLVKKNKLSDSNLILYNIGFFSFCFRLILLNISIISRLADSYILLTIFPILYYLEDLHLRKKWAGLLLFCTGMVMFYFVKTLLFPTAEYLYKSIYF